MCQNQTEGGLRCAAHTRPRFYAATFGTAVWDDAAADYASTRSGAVDVAALGDAARRAGEVEREVALSHALVEGAHRRERALAVRDALSREAEARKVLHDPAVDNVSVLRLSNEPVGITNEGGPEVPSRADAALDWEQREWDPKTPPSAMDRSAISRVGKPYRAAVPPAIRDMHFDLDPAVAAAAEDARAEITRFDAELSDAFDGEFAPLASVLLRTESSSSSQIENITAGSRALALAELGITKDRSNAKTVVANVDAMKRALDLSDEFTPETILAIHEALMRDHDYADPGTFRTEQVWIGGDATSPHGATFVPPHHERLRPAIDDLCAFATRTDVPLLAHAAIAHAQFETIHPFIDGNGRTGRALVHAMLKHGRATTRTTVPVSAGLLSDTDSYFNALNAYREGNPNPIVARFSAASFAAINNGRELADDLTTIHNNWKAALNARSDSVAWRILPILLSQPAVTSKLIQERTGASQPATDRALKQLTTAGIVTPKNEHGENQRRDIVWRSDEVLAALNDFGSRAKRQRLA